jgi:magnesium-transporting ATPase (P-type)
MSSLTARPILGAICLVYAVNIVTHATRLMATYRSIAGNDGDGVNDLYDTIDTQLWKMGLFTVIAISSVLLIFCLRRRIPN